MQQIFSNTTLTVNQLIEKIDTGELLAFRSFRGRSSGRIQRYVICSIP